MSLRTLRRLAVFAAALALSLSASAASAIAQSPGDPTLTIGVGDDVAGGETQIDFVLHYSGTTANGTPVYIYVPEGTPLDGSAPTCVASLDPAFDHNPGDEFVPCADADVADYTITQAQIDHLGDELVKQRPASSRSTRSTSARWAADPTEPASDSLVMMVSTTCRTRTTTTAPRRRTRPGTSPPTTSTRPA